MRKILSGLFFRLIKGFEIWAIIALLIWASVAIDKILFATSDISAFRNESMNTVYDGKGKESPELLVQERFEHSGMSAYDLYRGMCEPVEIKDSYNVNAFYESEEELVFFCSILGVLIIVPAVLIVLFIPVFFGRLFSDGTLKNYIACGQSKITLYLASLMFCFALDVFMVLVNALIFLCWCIYYAWKPPVYFPVVLGLFLSSLLLLFVITSVCLFALLASSKRSIPFIVGLLIVPVFLFTNLPALLPASKLIEAQELYSLDSAEYKAYMDIMMKNNEEEKYIQPYYVKLDPAEFRIKISYKGKEIPLYKESSLNPAFRSMLLATIYLNPAMVYQFTFNYEETILPSYVLYRDGFMAINIVNELLWITVFTGIGISRFRKHEIAC